MIGEPVDPKLLPSVAELVRASIAAALVVALVGVVAVLPAEYAIDPTGLGSRLGLLQLGELKLAEQGLHPQVEGVSVFGEEVVTRVLEPGEGLELKAIQREGDQLMYAWTASGPLYFDLHAEPAGSPKDVYESYGTGTVARDEGVHTAAFDGRHGWYWKNRGEHAVDLELRLTGAFVGVE